MSEQQVVTLFWETAVAFSGNPWIQAGIVACLTVTCLLGFFIFEGNRQAHRLGN
jgi:hypothetical protein